MKKLYLLLSIITLFLHPLTVSAEKINIINDLENVSIMVDGTTYSTNALYNFDIEPGTHHIVVKSKNETIYSKIVTVTEGVTTTIDTNDTSMYKAKPVAIRKKEIKEIRKNRGSLGVGFQFQSISGLSIKKYLGPLGIQIVGWGGTDAEVDYDDYNNSNSDVEKTDNSDYRVNLRLTWTLKEKQLYGKKSMRLYTGLGYGIDTYEYSDLSYDYYTDRNTQVVEALLGVEYDTHIGSWTFGMAYRIKESTYTLNTYTYTLIGFMNMPTEPSWKSEEITESIQGFLLNVGYHFYF